MNAARTAGVLLVLAGIALAGPGFRLGTKLTWRGDAGSSGVAYDYYGDPVFIMNYDRAFVGATAEIVYGPVWNVLSGRIDIYQIRIHPDDAQLEVFLLPMIGLDLLAELPVSWRAKPYVWAGIHAPENVGAAPWWPPHGAATHWCGGLGAKYKLTKRIDLFAETQLYSNDVWRDGFSKFHEGAFSNRLSGIETTGLIGAELGARFTLGK